MAEDKGVTHVESKLGDYADEIPENVLKIKEKLENKTGKKYRYRPAEKDLPGVGVLLQQGAINDQPKTWKQTIAYALVLTSVFLLSFTAYFHLVLSKPSNIPARGKYQRRGLLLSNNYMQQQSTTQALKQETREQDL